MIKQYLKKHFWWVIVVVAIAVILVVITGESKAQEVYFDAEVIEGHLVFDVSAEGVEFDGTYGRVDRYDASFHGPDLRNSTFTHSFGGMVETDIQAQTAFPLACVQWEEELGIMAGANERCYDEMVGSDFNVTMIEYNSIGGASPTGLGYEVDSPVGAGEIGFRYELTECTRTFNEPEEGDPVVISEGSSETAYASRVRGEWAGFQVSLIPSTEPAAAMAENGRTFLDLCPGNWR